jgi:hypothetical protein
MGWTAAAHANTVFSFPRLIREKSQFSREALAYIQERHPEANAMEIDAMRHGYVSAKMAQRHGQDYTLYLGYLNEAARDLILDNEPSDRGMDLYNNRVGSDFIAAHPSLTNGQLLDAIWDKVKDGSLIVSMEDPRAQRSYAADNHHAAGFFEGIRAPTDYLTGLVRPFKASTIKYGGAVSPKPSIEK